LCRENAFINLPGKKSEKSKGGRLIAVGKRGRARKTHAKGRSLTHKLGIDYWWGGSFANGMGVRVKGFDVRDGRVRKVLGFRGSKCLKCSIKR